MCVGNADSGGGGRIRRETKKTTIPSSLAKRMERGKMPGGDQYKQQHQRTRVLDVHGERVGGKRLAPNDRPTDPDQNWVANLAF